MNRTKGIKKSEIQVMNDKIVIYIAHIKAIQTIYVQDHITYFNNNTYYEPKMKNEM